jgi:heme-degrading monooxygenase HmoA
VQKDSIAQSIFRVDRFTVPASALEEFMARASQTHELLETMTGCLQSRILEQVSGPGEFNIVTIVEWDSAESFENASAVMAMHREKEFNPQEMFARLGIKADLANYRQVNPEMRIR